MEGKHKFGIGDLVIWGKSPYQQVGEVRYFTAGLEKAFVRDGTGKFHTVPVVELRLYVESE